jgi:ABC-type glycerol-3-phosphate transport system substrate-binding protein
MEFVQHREYEAKLLTAIAAGAAPDIWAQSYRLVEKYKDNLDPITSEDLKAMSYANMDTRTGGRPNSWPLNPCRR